MKEITIKSSTIFKEILIWGVLLVVAFLTNVYAINKYGGQWDELFSQLHVVFILSVVYYVIAALVRVILYLLIKLVKQWIIPRLSKPDSVK